MLNKNSVESKFDYQSNQLIKCEYHREKQLLTVTTGTHSQSISLKQKDDNNTNSVNKAEYVAFFGWVGESPVYSPNKLDGSSCTIYQPMCW